MSTEEILRRELELAYETLRAERPLRIQTAVENEALKVLVARLQGALEEAPQPDVRWEGERPWGRDRTQWVTEYSDAGYAEWFRTFRAEALKNADKWDNKK
jgi:hypothetical protein